MLSLFSLEILCRMPVEQKRSSPDLETGRPPRRSLHWPDSGRSPGCWANYGRWNRIRHEAAESCQSVGVLPVLHEKVSRPILKLTCDLLQHFVHCKVVCKGFRRSFIHCFLYLQLSELLDRHNPWYCPMCKENQCAKRTMTVWKYPDTLIIQLKRFVCRHRLQLSAWRSGSFSLIRELKFSRFEFHNQLSTKIDSKVIFPITDLDLSQHVSNPGDVPLLYDLQSYVCHNGGRMCWCKRFPAWYKI